MIYHRPGNIPADTIRFDVTPTPAPRQTRSDAWKNRPCVLRYRAFRDEVRMQANLMGFEMPECRAHITFYLPMPKSWSGKKKDRMLGMPHQQKPDADNLVKALKDALCKEDSHIWDYRITKVWSDVPMILIQIMEDDDDCTD